MAWAPARAKRRRVPREQCARSCVWWVSLLPPPLLPNPRMCAAGSRVRVGPRPARSRVGVLLFTLYSLHARRAGRRADGRRVWHYTQDLSSVSRVVSGHRAHIGHHCTVQTLNTGTERQRSQRSQATHCVTGYTAHSQQRASAERPGQSRSVTYSWRTRRGWHL